MEQNGKTVIRVFPRKTNASPTDNNVRFSLPLRKDEADEVHISVTFTYDLKEAEYLYSQWKYVAPTLMGGAAFGDPSGNFISGMYLKKGCVITSRGCNNKCWFCSVWKREGLIRELPITEGWNVMDDNLLACSESHRNKVFEMLKKQTRSPRFTGGLESKLLTEKIAIQLKELKPESMYFAYDTKDDLDPLIEAGKILKDVGFGKSHDMMCYVLIGYPKDTFENAEKRIHQTIDAGFMPFAMLYRDQYGFVKKDWSRFQRQWANMFISASNMRKYNDSFAVNVCKQF